MTTKPTLPTEDDTIMEDASMSSASSDQDDDFHDMFDDDIATEHAETTEPVPPKATSGNGIKGYIKRHPKISIGIGFCFVFVIALLIMLKVYYVVFSVPKTSRINKNVIHPTFATTSTQTIKLSSPPKVTMAPSVTTALEAQNAKRLEASFKQINASIAANTQVMQQVEKTLQAIQALAPSKNSIQQVQTTITSVNQALGKRVDNVQATVGKLYQLNASAQRAKARQEQQLNALAPTPLKHWKMLGVTANRAVIVGPSGQIFPVTKGDSIDGLGIVTQITTSGVIVGDHNHHNLIK